MKVLEVSEMRDIVEEAIDELRASREISDSTLHRKEMEELIDKMDDVLFTLDLV